jgi:tRNA pseudouridine55 synthase
VNGILVLDKPQGLTSFEATRAVGRTLGEKRVGHGGTLDPLATGVLPICLGEATKLAAFLQGADKEYEAAVRFGIETDTHDSEGKTTATRETTGLSEIMVRAALGKLLGPQLQRPPMYSAVRMSGKRLYELARAGVEVEREPREIVVHALELLEFGDATARFRVACSKGTYIRVLCADLGRLCGTGAHMTALRRTRSGPFAIEDAVTLEALAPAAVQPPASALPDWPLVRVEPALVPRIRDGQRVLTTDLGAQLPAGSRIRLVTLRGNLLALGEVTSDGVVRSLRGFNYGLTEEPTSAILTGN